MVYVGYICEEGDCGFFSRKMSIKVYSRKFIVWKEKEVQMQFSGGKGIRMGKFFFLGDFKFLNQEIEYCERWEISLGKMEGRSDIKYLRMF